MMNTTGWDFSLRSPPLLSRSQTAYFGSLKDQYYFRNGALLETGFGVDQYNTISDAAGR